MMLGKSFLAVGAVVAFFALLPAGIALALHLPKADWLLDGRLSTAGLWVVCAVTALFASFALETPADSLAMLTRLVCVVCFLAALVTALPTFWRRLAISLAILLHLAAIATAVTVVPPPQAPAPWVSMQLWMRAARPWLMLTNLNNGYHFYAPEPGPCALLWFRVEFADGASTWVKMPDHPKCANHIERRRMGALANYLGNTVPREVTQEMFDKRDRDAEKYSQPIPLGGLPRPMLYREAGTQGKLMLSSFARYVLKTTQHPKGEKDIKALRVKIYRVEYSNPPVEHFQAGRDPLDPTLYAVWFQGTYDAKGSLDPVSDSQLLWWLLPIVRVDAEAYARGEFRQINPEEDGWNTEGKIINYVRIHAGDKDEDSIP
jgi:hypothetical protein